MKFAALILFAASIASGQTFTRYAIKDWNLSFSQNYPNYTRNNYTNQLSFSVPTNTIFRGTIISGEGYAYVFVKFPESAELIQIGSSGETPETLHNRPILGPATVYFDGWSSTILQTNGTESAKGSVSLLAEFSSVNVTPELQGYAVQPNGKTASVQLETSADLKTWTQTTNGIYPATNQAAFYRLKMDVQ